LAQIVERKGTRGKLREQPKQIKEYRRNALYIRKMGKTKKTVPPKEKICCATLL
jgi:hypothetical protein